MNRVTLAQQVNDLDILSKFVDLLQDPKAIKKAHEEAREQLKLTDEEQAKYDAAKGLVAKQEKLVGELKDRQDILNETMIKHEETLKDIAERNNSLAESTQILKSEMAVHSTNVERLKNDRQGLENLSSQLNIKKADLEEKENSLAEKEAALNVRAERILSREQALEIREKANPL